MCRGKADFVWVIDADDLLVGHIDLNKLEADSYLLRFGVDFVYWRQQIFRSNRRWKYEGVVHEHPVSLDEGTTRSRLEGDYRIESRRLGDRNRKADKYERDCELLLEVLEQNPDDGRTVFYLAQSYYDAGDYRSALQTYSRCVEMGGWDEQVFYAHLRVGMCLDALSEPWKRVHDAFARCWQFRPSRAEPLYQIAMHQRIAGRYEIGYHLAKRAQAIPFPEEDVLFIAADVYAWRIQDERIGSSPYEIAVPVFRIHLQKPQPERSRTKHEPPARYRFDSVLVTPRRRLALFRHGQVH